MSRVLNLLAILLLVGCATDRSTETLTPLDDNAVTLRVGQVLLLQLPANHTTGYAWADRTPSQGILQRDGEPVYQEQPSPAGVGAGGTEIWRFRAVKVGGQTLRFEYARPWETNAAPARVLSYEVVVKPR
jgi:inhibitor of cysteine peptidase